MKRTTTPRLRTPASLRFEVVSPGGRVLTQHSDAESIDRARYEKFKPGEPGTYHVRVRDVDGEQGVRAQAIVLTGNRGILLPLIVRIGDMLTD